MGNEPQRLVCAHVALWLELHQRQDVKAKKCPDKGVSAIDAAVEVRSQQRVRGHAPVADRQQVVLIAVRFGADGQARKVNLVLPRRWHTQDLQLVVRHACELVRTKTLRLLCQGIEDVHSRDAKRDLSEKMAPGIRLCRARPGGRRGCLRCLTHGLIAARLPLQQHGAGGSHREGAGGQHVPQVECTVEDVFWQKRGKGLLDVRVDVAIGVVHVRAPPQFPEVLYGLCMFA
mmetsp:Transcript_85405/g.198566  ORF Transcript_85405/g.198566 Transcript_85405/m.198566 type:complete len:231 (-) Transcript_85405:171-863(-)